jgi:hypothetical protein
MIAESLHAKVVDEARRDAAAYFREFRATVGPKGMNWVAEAWDDIKCDFELAPDVAEEFWPVYWEAFSQETERLASGA